jgi:hypothetical protein
MNGQEIIEMGMLAGLCDEEGRDDASIIITDHMTRFAKLVAAKEREACAKVCDEWANSLSSEPEMAKMAAEIQARGEA